MSSFTTDAALELATAKAKHRPTNSATKVTPSFWESCKNSGRTPSRKKSDRDRRAMQQELIQVAAMVKRPAEHLLLV